MWNNEWHSGERNEPEHIFPLRILCVREASEWTLLFYFSYLRSSFDFWHFMQIFDWCNQVALQSDYNCEYIITVYCFHHHNHPYHECLEQNIFQLHLYSNYYFSHVYSRMCWRWVNWSVIIFVESVIAVWSSISDIMQFVIRMSCEWMFINFLLTDFKKAKVKF